MGELDYTKRGLNNFWDFLKSTLDELGWSQRSLIDELKKVGYTITPDKISRLLSGGYTKPDANFLVALTELKILKNRKTQIPYNTIDLIRITCGQIDPVGSESIGKLESEASKNTTIGDFLFDAIEDLGKQRSIDISGLNSDRLDELIHSKEVPTLAECQAIANLLNEANKKRAKQLKSGAIKKITWIAEAIHVIYAHDALSNTKLANGFERRPG